MWIWIDEKSGGAACYSRGLWRRNTSLALLVFVAVTTALLTATRTALAHDTTTPGAVGAAATLDGLVADETLCGTGYRIPGTDLCTHGSDELPAGAGEDPDQPLAPPSIVCVGDGVDGKRVQVMYVRTEDTPDRYGEVAGTIRAWAAGVDALFDRSAHATGGHRHIRFVTDANCEIDVLNVVLPAGTDETFIAMISALKTLGYDSPDRKYLIFAEADFYCGIGTIIGDATPGPENRNNERTGYARVDTPCWGSDTAAHELTHTLGGVQHSAPNASGGWHCTDEFDLMCYSDPPHYPAMAYSCQLGQNILLDCNHDDYYHTDPPAESYLATHWNVANSLFLTSQEPPNTPPILQLTTPGDIHSFVAPARIHLIANATDSDGSVVRVDFYEGATLLATSTSSPFVFTWEGAPAGTYTITATAYDDDGASATAAPLQIEVTQPPNIPPEVTLTAPADREWVAPAMIPITATAVDPDGSIARVEFYSGESLLVSDDHYPYAITWNIASSGVYTVSARAYDHRGASTASASLTVVVKEPATVPPVVHLSMVAAATMITTPMTVTLAAEVTTTHAAVVRVDFYVGEALLGSDFDEPFLLTWRVQSGGTYTLTARAHDMQGLSATSPPLALTVAPSEDSPIDRRQSDEELSETLYLPVVLRTASNE